MRRTVPRPLPDRLRTTISTDHSTHHLDRPVPTALALPGWGTSPERLVPILEALRDQGVDARPHRYEPSGSIRALT